MGIQYPRAGRFQPGNTVKYPHLCPAPGGPLEHSGETDPRTPEAEVARRNGALVGRLGAIDVDLVIVTTNPNLYYLTGSVQEGMVTVHGDLARPVYLVRRSLERAQRESPLEDIRPAVRPSALLEAIGLPPLNRVGLELDTVPHAWAERLRKGLGGADVELIDISNILREVRSVKSPWEVKQIERAAGQLDATMARAAEVLREGMTELELSTELERTMRALGHEGFVRMHRFNSEMYMGGVLSGPSATVPTFHQAVMGGWGLSPSMPHGASLRKVHRGEPVAIDLCAVSMGYIADQTRTFVVGTLTPEAQDAFDSAQGILHTLEGELRAGSWSSAMWEMADRLAHERGWGEGFMGIGVNKLRFIGHGVGLELDELPVLADRVPGTVPEGAVVALEPKIVVPELGVLGEENTYVVGADGLRPLTRSRPGPVEVP